jgi:predicted nuclease of predicted toxin-antitoxin system
MKFLVDAQLPRRLARQLSAAGHDAIHTLDLPARNLTDDDSIRELAERDGRVVVTKDSDFVDSHILRGQPPKLLLVTTGNITNDELESLFAAHLSAIVATFSGSVFVELDRDGLIVRS